MKTKTNNKVSIKLTLNDETTVTLIADSLIETELAFLDMTSIINFKQKVLLLKIRHSKTNTIMDLTHVVPYVLLFFNEKLEFCGASYSLNKEGASYMLQTEYKTILFVKHPNNLILNTINNLSHEDH